MTLVSSSRITQNSSSVFNSVVWLFKSASSSVSSCTISVNIPVLTLGVCVPLDCADHTEFHWLQKYSIPESRLPRLIKQDVLWKELLLVLIKLWKFFIGFLTLYPLLIFKQTSPLLIFLHTEMFPSFKNILSQALTEASVTILLDE